MASTDADTLEARLEKRTKKNLLRVARRVKSMVASVTEDLINSTPVDTGEARSNWRVTVGEVVNVRHPPFYPLPHRTDPDKFYEPRNAAMAVELSNATVAAISEETILDGVPIYIQNHAPQTAWINKGTVLSAQQDPTFVEDAVKAGRIRFHEGKGK